MVRSSADAVFAVVFADVLAVDAVAMVEVPGTVVGCSNCLAGEPVMNLSATTQARKISALHPEEVETGVNVFPSPVPGEGAREAGG
ncbi:hypothetical protein [Azospirillum himalayense]|uniref:Uncharacterized protein n=1 Tax=Azospirillum himalayense TaxID=654847 RepID=A0ABW0GEX5_9PROT